MTVSEFNDSEQAWIIGSGRVGRLIAIAERKYGSKIRLFDVTQGIVLIDDAQFTIEAGIFSGTPDRVWFCVPDDYLDQVIADWLKAGLHPKMALHTSGWHLPYALEPLVGASGEYAAVHPLRSLLGQSIDELIGVVFALAGTEGACNWAHEFSKSTGCFSVVIKPEEKPLVHLISQFASNLPFAMVAAIEQLSRSTSLPPELITRVVSEMVMRSTQNALELGAANAATGPVARNDRKMVSEAMKKLEPYPELQAFYKAYADLLRAAMKMNRE